MPCSKRVAGRADEMPQRPVITDALVRVDVDVRTFTERHRGGDLRPERVVGHGEDVDRRTLPAREDDLERLLLVAALAMPETERARVVGSERAPSRTKRLREEERPQKTARPRRSSGGPRDGAFAFMADARRLGRRRAIEEVELFDDQERADRPSSRERSREGEPRTARRRSSRARTIRRRALR